MSNFNDYVDMRSFFIGKYEIKLPIIQGGMGVGVSLSGLASAVANEGGVGVISAAGLGLLYPQFGGNYLEKCILGLKEEIHKAREKTQGIIGVNIMVALSNFSDMVRTAIAEKADIIFAGAGLPLNLPSFLNKDSKTMLVPIVSSSRAAQVICEKWENNYHYLPDALVVEGPKAGGHLGFKSEQIEDEHYSLEHLIPEVVEVAKPMPAEKIFRLLQPEGYLHRRILQNLYTWELRLYRWGRFLSRPKNVMLPLNLRKYILIREKRIFVLSRVRWVCPDVLLTVNLSGRWLKEKKNRVHVRFIV